MNPSPPVTRTRLTARSPGSVASRSEIVRPPETGVGPRRCANAGSSQRTPRRGLRDVRVTHLVEHLDVSAQRLEAVREAVRDVEHPPVAALSSDRRTSGGRSASPARRSTTTSKIAPRDAAHQLGLPVRRRPGSACPRSVPARALNETLALHDRGSRPRSANASRVEGAREPAALVARAAPARRPHAAERSVSTNLTAARASSGARAANGPPHSRMIRPAAR